MNSRAQLAQAVASESRGDFAGAIAGYRKVLAREPSNIDALFLLGRAHCQQGRLEDGVQALRKAVTLRPNHAPAQTLLGMALARAGRTQEALACFERAAGADPRFEPALISRADMLDALGRHNEAIAAYDQALAVNAGNVVTWCNRGTALEALGRDLEAVESFRRAADLNGNLPEVHFNLANALQRLQRYEDAVRHYRRAVALRPNLTPAFINLGRALVSLGRWQEAEEVYQRALKLEPRSAQAHDALGYVWSMLERYEDSLASFDKALAINPDFSPTLNKKARLLYTFGHQDESRILIERAIAIDPGNPNNYLMLAEMKKFELGDPQLAAMENLLPAIESRPPQDQVELHFALGKAYADAGRHEQSFHHFLKGNALKRAEIVYDEPAAIDSLERIARVFTPELLRSKAGHGNPSTQPIFIIGMPRSGTTLIEQILASHPDVHGAGERQDFKNALTEIAGAQTYPEVVQAMAAAQLDALGTAYLASMTASALAAARFTDKLPANYIYAGLIRLALPNARIIHARRNPIDTCLSCFAIRFRLPQNFAYDLGELGRFYRAYERVMEHWRRVLPDDAMLDVQYEDVVADVETQARRVVAYCGLEWNEACLAFHQNRRAVHTASASQVRRPIYKSSVERWRAYEKHLGPLLEALGEAADAH